RERAGVDGQTARRIRHRASNELIRDATISRESNGDSSFVPTPRRKYPSRLKCHYASRALCPSWNFIVPGTRQLCYVKNGLATLALGAQHGFCRRHILRGSW